MRGWWIYVVEIWQQYIYVETCNKNPATSCVIMCDIQKDDGWIESKYHKKHTIIFDIRYPIGLLLLQEYFKACRYNTKYTSISDIPRQLETAWIVVCRCLWVAIVPKTIPAEYRAGRTVSRDEITSDLWRNLPTTTGVINRRCDYPWIGQ